MSRIFFLLLTIVFISNGLQAQLSEKFLKLNRVITLDSVKTKTFTLNGNAETVFSLTVPAGVYWKIESISFNPSFDQNVNDIHDVRVKINTADLLFQLNYPTNNYTNFNFQFNGNGWITGSNYINNFIRNTPTWAGPSSVINMYVKNSTLSGKTLNFEMTLTAMEFILE